MSLHDLHGVLLDTTKVAGVNARNITGGGEVRAEPADGNLNPTFISTTGQKPAASFTTMAIATALAKLNAADGTYWTITGAGCVMYARTHVAGGTRAGASLHRSYTFNLGIVIPRTLTVDHQGDATLDCDVIITYDGNNDPVVISADTISLPSGFNDIERFALPTSGGIVIGNDDGSPTPATLSSVRSMSIDFGVTATTEGADSDVWDTQSSIQSIAPVITLNGIDIAWLQASGITDKVPFAGLSIEHASTAIYLRKRATGGTFVADATAEHIKFTAGGLAHIDNVVSGSSNLPNECSLTLTCFRDTNDNNPLVIDTAIALP